jgi:two-component system chemotaxis response regulator CheY
MKSAIDFNQKVLVVDDFSTMRMIIHNMLKKIGFSNICEAENGAAALSLLRSDQIGLVLADWHMPVMTGLELLQRIRREPAVKDIPVLMVTAEEQTENILRAIKAGADNFIVKPFTTATIRDKIAQIFRKRR